MGKKVSALDALAVGSVVEASDLAAIFDASAGKLKKISVEDLLSLAPGLDISALPVLALGDIASADKVPILDVSASVDKVITMQSVFQYIFNNAQSLANINAGGIDGANDYVILYDSSTFACAKISVTDFLSLAGGGGLTNWTEDTGTNGFGVDTYSRFVATGAGTNIDAVISPKGNGSLVAKAGNTSDRGSYSVDLQIDISASSASVAKASYSCITHGYGNEVDAAATYSRAGGRYAVARRYGEDVWTGASSSNSSGTGDQVSKMVLLETITGIAATELSADSTTTKRIEMAGTDSLLRVVVDLIATCTSPGNGTTVLTEVYSTSKAVVIHISAGVSTIIGTTTYGTAISQASMADSDLTFDIDAGTQDLKVLYTPPSTAGTTTIIKVVAGAHITQLYGN